MKPRPQGLIRMLSVSTCGKFTLLAGGVEALSENRLYSVQPKPEVVIR